MNLTPVKSSAVEAVGYEDGVMEVVYRGGRRYRMEGVSQDQYDALLTADSIGRALNSLKATCAACARVDDEDEQATGLAIGNAISAAVNGPRVERR